MNYELVNVMRADTDNWKEQKKRAIKNKSALITLAPDPVLGRKRQEDFSNAVNIIDLVVGRTVDKEGSLFFDKAPTIEGAQIFMNPDGFISIIKNGETVGSMRTFPNTRRLVQDITYFNADGTRDLVEEYTFDGKLYSNIFYYKSEIQEIEFFDDDQNVRLRFHFYLGNINLITVEDPKTHVVEKTYKNMMEFQATQVAEIVNENDTVGITYLGLELDALAKTKSENTLYLEEPAFDNDQLKGNLQLILNGQISYIHKVVVSAEDYKKMLIKGIDMSKVVKK
ncbi:hypothetical protein FEZ51_04075 [Pediococcus stilesii]|uniref:Uncharacterized protein n=1 Tax=Pediococcus stilesii TaxID=331679 RepID=A0A5R9BY80_9LACO|nr:hypothetical protein [Pediococcus stilesii]TLQ04822.1 hypothetical protein FEZ51_04075 [Pediococcus stilesii]